MTPKNVIAGAALIGALAAGGGIVASSLMSPGMVMCTTAQDGGLCLYVNPDGGAHKYGPGVVFPVDGANGDCAPAFPCTPDP